MNRPTRFALVAALAACLVAVACTSSDNSPPAPAVATPGEATPTAAPATTPSPIISPTPPSGGTGDERRTGSPFLDVIVEGVDARDVAALAALIQPTEIGCTHVEGLGGPPKCAPEQAEGDLVWAFPGAACHGYWSDTPAQSVATLVHHTRGLYAAAAVAGDASLGGEWPVADTLLVFHADWYGSPAALRLHVAEGRIIGTWSGCGAVTPESLLTAGVEGDVSVIAGPWDDPHPVSVEVPATGVAALDGVLAAVATYNVVELIESAQRAMQALPQVECVEQLNFPGDVECDPEKGEQPGDLVSVFPLAYCEGALVRDPAPALRVFLDQASVLHSVLEAPSEPSQSDLYRHGAYWLVYELTGETHGVAEAARLHVTAEGNVTLVWYGCLAPLRELVTWDRAPLPRIPFEMQAREE
jgi:hypothetical protein